MKNTDIKYELSKDYNRLYELLHDKLYKVVGFLAMQIRDDVLKEYSRISVFEYKSEYHLFDLGFSFFEQDFDKISFIKLCEQNNIQFFDIKD